jgi:ribosomal protein L37AE/L43A
MVIEQDGGSIKMRTTLTLAVEEHQKKKVRCPKCKSESVKHLIASVFVTTSRKS